MIVDIVEIGGSEESSSLLIASSMRWWERELSLLYSLSLKRTCKAKSFTLNYNSVIKIGKKDFQLINMFRKIPVVNKLVQQKTIQRTRLSHLRRLSSTRNRQSQVVQEQPHQLNLRKKQLLIEEKFTQIERQNRLLLEKITTIMSKKRSHREKQSTNSLNWSFRKRQLRGIEKQNFKMLKRLQNKRSDYQWKRNKQLIDIHSQFPKTKRQSRAVSSYAKSSQRPQENLLFAGQLIVDQRQFKIEIVQTKKCICIWGWDVESKDYKVIKIPCKQAQRLVQSQFDGDISRMTERLRYCDGKLYLFAKGEMHDQS